MTDFTDTGEPQQKAIDNAGLESLGDGCVRRPEKILEHFHGLPLVEPDLERVQRWFPGEPGRELPAVEDLEPRHRVMRAGLGYKEWFARTVKARGG